VITLSFDPVPNAAYEQQ